MKRTDLRPRQMTWLLLLGALLLHHATSRAESVSIDPRILRAEPTALCEALGINESALADDFVVLPDGAASVRAVDQAFPERDLMQALTDSEEPVTFKKAFEMLFPAEWSSEGFPTGQHWPRSFKRDDIGLTIKIAPRVSREPVVQVNLSYDLSRFLGFAASEDGSPAAAGDSSSPVQPALLV